MNISSIVNKIKDKYDTYQVDQAKKRAEEEARKQSITSGDINPITCTISLGQNENAYFECKADRLASVEYIVEKTTGKTKKKGVIGRAIVGALVTPHMFGVGAVVGALTAGSKNESVTTQEHIEKVEEIDSGRLLLTNQRIIFVGNKEVINIPYNEILSFESNWAYEVCIKYPSMIKGELYQVHGDNRKDIDLYYKGITEHIFTNK